MAGKKHDSEGCFVVEFPLEVEKYQADIIDKRMEIGRRIYNQLLSKYNKIYKEMTQTKEYRNIIAGLRVEREKRGESGKKTSAEKELYKQLNEQYKRYGFNEFAMIKMAYIQRKPFDKHISSRVAGKIGSRLWAAWNRFLFMDGRKIAFSKYGEFNSLESNEAGVGIRLKHNYKSKNKSWTGEKSVILWNGLELPVKIDWSKNYESECFTHEIAYNRVVRRFVRGRYKYYVQIVFKGRPPVKYNSSGEAKHPLGKGTVGVNVTTDTLYAVSEKQVLVKELADKVQNMEERIAYLQRRMERSRRDMNPDNYNTDGTIRKTNEGVKWIYSNHYMKWRAEARELYRKQAAVRKQQHYILANELLAMGDTFYIEKTDYKKLQQRLSKEEAKTQKYRCRRNQGKVIANRAPSTLIDIIKNKLEQMGGSVGMVDSVDVIDELNAENDLYHAFVLSIYTENGLNYKIYEQKYPEFLQENICS